MLSNGVSTNITPDEKSDLVSISLKGSRPIALTFSADLFRLLNENESSVLERAKSIISLFPEEWPADLHDGAEGQQASKRAVKIKLSSPLKYTDAQGVTHALDALQITGVLFTQEFLTEQTPHTGHTAGFLDPHSFFSDLPQELRNSGIEDAFIRLVGSRKKFTEELTRLPRSIDFDQCGAPVFSQSLLALCGGHGATTAQAKFINGTYHLPRLGINGPLAFGYGEYTDPQFKMGEKKIGVYLSFLRSNEVPRLSEFLEDAVLKHSQSKRDEIAKLSLQTARILVDPTTLPRSSLSPQISSAITKLSALAETFSDPANMLRTHFPVDLYQEAYFAYGRALRRLVGDDLTNLDRMLIPFRFPHQGNLSIDFSRPHPDGGYYETWYDLGGWRFGKDMTREQAFSFVYYTFDYGLTTILKPIQKQSSQISRLVRSGDLNPVERYLAGFFFDQQKNKDFLGWKIERIDAHLNTTLTFIEQLKRADLPAPCDRIDMPYVRLLRSMMGFEDTERRELISLSKIQQIIQSTIPKSTRNHRSYRTAESSLLKELKLLAEDSTLDGKSVVELFNKFKISDTAHAPQIAERINNFCLKSVMAGRRIDFAGEDELTLALDEFDAYAQTGKDFSIESFLEASISQQPLGIGNLTVGDLMKELITGEMPKGAPDSLKE